jgi:hypothetical protein
MMGQRHRSANRTPRRARLGVGVIAALLIATLQLAVNANTDQAGAATCPGGLTAGTLPVTGDDCFAGGDGSVEITNPRLGDSEGVQVTGRMVLLDGTMTTENPLSPLLVTVGSRPVVAGDLTVGIAEVCDIATPRSQDEIRDPELVAPDDDDFATGEDLLPRETGCRETGAITVRAPNMEFAGQLAGMDLGLLRDRPLVLGVDDARGGRVFGTFALTLPTPPFSGERIGLGAEFSSEEGLAPTSIAIDLPGRIPLAIPGVVVSDLLASIDPLNERASAAARIILPSRIGLFGSIGLDHGRLTQLGAQLAFPRPVPLVAGVGLSTIGFDFEAATSTSDLNGRVTSTPASFLGQATLIAGPSIAGRGPITGDLAIRIAGPTFSLTGDLFALDRKIRLGGGRILVSTSPARFEAEASLNFLDIISGRVFLGVTPNAFTGLGRVAFSLPKKLPIIGGKRFGGIQGVISNNGAGGLVTIDPPIFKPFSVGASVSFDPVKFKIVKSIESLITVRPTRIDARSVGREDFAPRAAAAAELRIPRGVPDALISVEGAGGSPDAVRFRSGGNSVKALRLFTQDDVAYFGIAKPPAGPLTITSRSPMSKIQLLRARPFPYLDPKDVYIHEAQPPVAAGTPVRVCWNIEHAPRGAVVDLFEDQNGSLGTGRQIASGRRSQGCFNVPTAGLEPGNHWVYGTIRVDDHPISSRYWPIPIVVTDRSALRAPSDVAVRRTGDGAEVTFKPVPGAAGYEVIAQPVGGSEGREVVSELLAVSDRLVAHLSLRGARKWEVRVQAFGPDGARGNLSRAFTTSATDPVVLDGQANGFAQVGEPWALDLDIDPDTSLRLVSGAGSARLDGSRALLTWTPSAAAGTRPSTVFVLEACKEDRCVQREFAVSVLGHNLAPFGPARGFAVTPNVVGPGDLVTLRAQGVDGVPRVRVDGKIVKARRVNESAVTFRAPKLAPGPHSVTLKIGSDVAETEQGAFTVLGGR